MHALREHTAQHHERLEGRLDIGARLTSLAGYRALLERLRGFYGPLEERLAAQAEAVPGLDFPARRKTPLLDADLRTLAGHSSPPATALPAVETPSQALGVLYVLEGATLGGKLIARAARRRLGVTPEAGAAFFAAYGSGAAARWRSFGDAVEAARPDQREACAAAADCFERLEAWLCD
jgi:heme oxygenase